MSGTARARRAFAKQGAEGRKKYAAAQMLFAPLKTKKEPLAKLNVCEA